jgi:GNAT superfamily N-acetyltransferase
MADNVTIRAVWAPAEAQEAGRIFAELAPLLVAYWDEVRPPKFGPFEFDTLSFVRQWHKRELIFVEIRADAVLVGFLFVLQKRSIFCRDVILHSVTAYIQPEHRGSGLHRRAIKYVKELASTLNAIGVYCDRESREGSYQVITEEVI